MSTQRDAFYFKNVACQGINVIRILGKAEGTQKMAKRYLREKTSVLRLQRKDAWRVPERSNAVPTVPDLIVLTLSQYADNVNLSFYGNHQPFLLVSKGWTDVSAKLIQRLSIVIS